MHLYCISNRSARLSTKVVKVVHPFDGLSTCLMDAHLATTTSLAPTLHLRQSTENIEKMRMKNFHMAITDVATLEFSKKTCTRLLILGFSQIMRIFCLRLLLLISKCLQCMHKRLFQLQKDLMWD